jgi:lysophospholipase L1-like esterase
VVAALALAVVVGVIFDAFVALFLVALTAEVMWLILLMSPKASLARFFPSWTIAAGVTLILLVTADVVLNWGPVAARLGTPEELAQWESRYDRVKASNFFHFRSPYEDTRRRAGVRRIIALGDSFTEGHGIWSSDSTWPAQLERELTQAPDGQPTEVINMGHGGFTTANEAELLRRIGWQFDPDLVIVQWLDNDAYRSYPNFRFEQAEAVRIIPQQFRSGLIQRSAILALIETGLSAAKEASMRSLYTPEGEGWRQLQAALIEMADSARRRGVPIVLVAYPYLFPGTWTPETYPERDLSRLVTDAARKDGFETLDLTDVFATTTHPEQDWWVTPYDSHPNATAQHRATLAIARFIRERHLLPETLRSHPRCQ